MPLFNHPMSADPFRNFDRFLRRVRHRLTVLRLLERVGVAVAMSSAVALPLIGLLAWRGASAMQPTLLCLGLGILGGIAWGASSAPTVLETALQVDRQLDWADLLTSALYLRAAPDDAWRFAVLIDAERRCTGLSPSTIFLRRLSSQAWSGIGLALTLVLALSAWVGLLADSLARDAQALSVSNPAQPPDIAGQPLLAQIPIGARRRSAAPPDGQDTRTGDPSPAAPDHGDGSAPLTQSQSPAKATTPSDGQGGVLGRTNPRSRGVPPSDSAAAIGSSPAGNGKPTGGNSASIDVVPPGTGAVGGTVTRVSGRPSEIAPWSAAEWPREVEAAQRAISSGEVSPPFRDLVREYFQRD